MNNTLNEISNRLQKQVSDRAQAITDANAKLGPARTARRETADRLKAAQETGNPNAYAKAAEHHRTACDIVTMHEKRLEAIERKPAIDMTTYQAAKAEIIDTMTQLNKTALAEALPLVDRLQALRDELGADLDQGNRLLRTLQRDWFGDTKSTEDRFKDYDLVAFIGYMLDLAGLNSLRGRKQ